MGAQPLPVRYEGRGDRGRVGVLTLDPGERPVVVIDAGLVARLEATLGALPDDLAGLVVASGSERVFVAGADLKEIQAADDAALLAYLEHTADVFGRLSQLPYPTAAAINGAALGGGLELAMHCDGLIGAPSASGRPYPVGLPEAGLCICPGWGGTNLLPARVDAEDAIRRTASGTAMTFDEACEAGLFDQVCEAVGGLVEQAIEWVCGQSTPERDGAPSRWIGRVDVAGGVGRALAACRAEIEQSEAGGAVVDCVGVGLEQGWDAAIARERESLVRLRHTRAARDAIEGFFAKSAKR
ncbi:MAG: enoyl-CoA hydratase/isomerase family protein [Phycisphaerales bacterium]